MTLLVARALVLEPVGTSMSDIGRLAPDSLEGFPGLDPWVAGLGIH